MFTRGELWDIETKATGQANVQGTNEDWVRALRDLAYAANILDAFLVRSIVGPNKD